MKPSDCKNDDSAKDEVDNCGGGDDEDDDDDIILMMMATC